MITRIPGITRIPTITRMTLTTQIPAVKMIVRGLAETNSLSVQTSFPLVCHNNSFAMGKLTAKEEKMKSTVVSDRLTAYSVCLGRC